MLADFTPASMHQGDLFADRQQDPRREALMKVIDQINQGRLGKVYFAAQGRDTCEWMMKRERFSPRYTTNIQDIPAVET
ncbi:DNA polymerase V subunit UmuC [compost metagenome]